MIPWSIAEPGRFTLLILEQDRHLRRANDPEVVMADPRSAHAFDDTPEGYLAMAPTYVDRQYQGARPSNEATSS